jgi:hypothetical protein
VPALVAVAPCGELPDSRLQHLIGMEACIFAQQRTRERGDQCVLAYNFDPWRNRCNALQSNDFREKRGGHGWTPIEHARNKQFRFCFNDLVLNRGGVQVGRRFTTPAPVPSAGTSIALRTTLNSYCDMVILASGLVPPCKSSDPTRLRASHSHLLGLFCVYKPRMAAPTRNAQ